jgi:hypothetical protein
MEQIVAWKKFLKDNGENDEFLQGPDTGIYLDFALSAYKY